MTSRYTVFVADESTATTSGHGQDAFAGARLRTALSVETLSALKVSLWPQEQMSWSSVRVYLDLHAPGISPGTAER
jgi:hypothetical protein